MAHERVLSYFLTDVIVRDATDDEQEKWEDFGTRVLDWLTIVQSGLRDRACYGNGFFSMLVPFNRFLRCPKCGLSVPLGEVMDKPAFAFRWECPNFVATCPSCKTGSGYTGQWHVDDHADNEEEKLKVKRWNPHEIELVHDYYTDDVEYLWRIPPDYQQQIRKGHKFHLQRASKGVLQAVAKNQMFKFKPGAIYHMKEPTLAGLVNRGWGLPRILINFRQIWYVQVLRRQNEALALDYVIPFRVIAPEPMAGGRLGTGEGIDPFMTMDGSDFRAQAMRMIRNRKRDPAGIQVFPFPVNFQMFGADATKLVPADIMDQAQQTLLNDTGVPVELYNGSLQLQAAPVALRRQCTAARSS